MDESIVAAVANSNLKAMAEIQTAAANRLAHLIVADAEAFAEIRRATTTKCVDAILNTDAAEAVAVQKVLSGNDLASTLSALGSAVAQIQQLTKAAQTTPPTTA